MNDIKPQKIVVKDASIDDNKIPRNLILKYGETPYVMKAGLEWKAAKMFGNGGYSMHIELVEKKPEYILVKATMTIQSTGVIFENYGEASKENVNSMMQKQLLHLAITRAECRVLRMATACGYASYDEVMTQPKENEKNKVALPISENDTLPATEAQKKTVQTLAAKNGVNVNTDEMTQATAKAFIAGINQK